MSYVDECGGRGGGDGRGWEGVGGGGGSGGRLKTGIRIEDTLTDINLFQGSLNQLLDSFSMLISTHSLAVTVTLNSS